MFWPWRSGYLLTASSDTSLRYLFLVIKDWSLVVVSLTLTESTTTVVYEEVWDCTWDWAGWDGFSDLTSITVTSDGLLLSDTTTTVLTPCEVCVTTS